MYTEYWQRMHQHAKDFLFRLLSKEFLVFLSFLAVSTAFWFLTALNDVYEEEFPIPLEITDVPENVIITEDLPDTIRVTVKDKGFNILNTMLEGKPQPVTLSFRTYATPKGKGAVTPAEIQKILRPRFSETALITSVKADHWDFYYNHGKKKKLPILLDSDITPRQNYYVTNHTLTPDSAVVYASDLALDTIHAVYTEHVRMENVSEASTFNVRLMHIHGAKVMPGEVQLSVITDQLTEVTINVPVKTINVPEDMSLKTFPARVDIRVAVAVRRSAAIKPEMFAVVADYNTLPAAQTDKLPLKILSQPKGIVKAVLKQPTVDYLIEK